MAIVYRFRVLFEEYEDVYRDIEIKSGQTFEDLHNAIQSAIGFDASQMASFYMSDDYWRKGVEITLMDVSEDTKKPKKTMNKSILSDFIDDPHQKMIYVFDFMAMWTFYIELIKIIPQEDPKAVYPRCVKTGGIAPKQYKSNVPPPSEEEEEMGLAKKSGVVFDEFEQFAGEEETDDSEDEFGFDAEDVPEGEEGPEQFQKGGYED